MESASGKRAKSALNLYLSEPLHAEFRRIDVDPYFPSSCTQFKLDKVFETEPWFDPRAPGDLGGSHVELSGFYEITSPMLGVARRHLLEGRQEGSGGNHVAPSFTLERANDRKAFYSLVEAFPTISMVDFSAIKYTPCLSLSQVNLGSYAPEHLWIAYRFFLSEMSLREHWKHHQLARRQAAVRGFSVISRDDFFRLVKVAREMQGLLGCSGNMGRSSRLGRLSRSSISAPAPDEPEQPPVPYFCMNGGDFLYWLGERSEILRISSGQVTREGSIPVECDASQPVYPLTWSLRTVASSFTELECIASDTAVSLVGHRAISAEIISTDAEGQIVSRTLVERCGFLGTGFPVVGAVASRELADRYNSKQTTSAEGFSTAQKVAVRRYNWRSRHGDVDLLAVKAANARDIQTAKVLPLGTPRRPRMLFGN